MFTDYTCHVFGERNAAHLTLLLEMSAVFILTKKMNFGKGTNGAHCHGGSMNDRELVSYATNEVANVR